MSKAIVAGRWASSRRGHRTGSRGRQLRPLRSSRSANPILPTSRSRPDISPTPNNDGAAIEFLAARFPFWLGPLLAPPYIPRPSA